jgi:GAF domain-containing protein
VPKRLQAALRSTEEQLREPGQAQEAARAQGRPPLDERSLVTLSPANRPGAVLTLGAGVASLSRMFERGDAPEARLTHAANVLQRAYHFQRVILCLKDPATGVFRAQIVSGKAPDTTAAQFGFKEMAAHDLFNAAVLQNADIYIRDATDAKLQQNLPSWFKLTCPDAKSFLLLSISGAAGTVGFFYADHADKNVPGLTGEEVHLVKTLKQLAWLAVHQAHSAVQQRSPSPS